MTDVKQLITEHLDIWLTAETEKKSGRGRSSGSNTSIYGVQKLRELIIDLAISGKLVSQNLEDEPINILLEKIKKELHQYINEGKIKKNQNIDIICNFPYELPKAWSWNKLANLAIINGGFAFKSSKYNEDGVRVIRISDFDESGLKSNNIVRHPFDSSLNNYLIETDNILMAMTGGTVGKSCYIKELPETLVSNQRVATIKPFKCINPNYVNLILKSTLTQLVIQEAKNSTNDNISMSDINNFWVALPPIEEQQRIVAKVDELMQLCDQLEQEQNLSTEAHEQLVDLLLDALTNSADADEFQQNWQRISANFDLLFTTDYSIEQLKQTILQLAVMGKLVKQDPSDEPASELLKQIAEEKAKLVKEGKIKKSKPLPEIGEDEKPFELPSGWEWCRILEVGSTSTGKTPPTKMQQLFEGNIPFIGPGQLSVNNTLLKSEKQLSEEGVSYSTEAFSGDILCVCIGGSIGKSLLLKSRVAFNQQLNCLSPIKVNNLYIYYVMQSDSFLEQIWKSATGSATPIINKGKWEEIIISLPPLNEQKRIIDKVNQLFSIIDQLRVLQNKARQTQLHLADVLVANAVEGA